MTEEKEEMKVVEELPQWCWQEEFKRYIDDCGSVYCTLTGATWDEWGNEDDCMSCPFAIWTEEAQAIAQALYGMEGER